MMKAAKKAQSETNKKLKILAVTILTSLTNKDLKQYSKSSIKILYLYHLLRKAHFLISSSYHMIRIILIMIIK